MSKLFGCELCNCKIKKITTNNKELGTLYKNKWYCLKCVDVVMFMGDNEKPIKEKPIKTLKVNDSKIKCPKCNLEIKGNKCEKCQMINPLLVRKKKIKRKLKKK